MIRIRTATPSDCPAIAAIWNPFIRDTLITFTSILKTPETLAQTLSQKAASGHPFLVAEAAGKDITGFASFGPFRDGPGYLRCMEHTLMVAPAAQGAGVGRALLAAIEAAGANAGLHCLIAGISGENPRAIAFHAAQGYTQVARLPQVGHKAGRALDLILMQKFLRGADTGTALR